MVPLTVNEEEPFVPDVNVRPVVEPSVNVPSETESVSESAAPAENGSVRVIASLLAVESVADPFSATLSVDGLLTAGAVEPYPANAGTSRLATGVPSPVTRS